MSKGINVLSLFDGSSAGMVALKKAGINVNRYFASEIDKYAIQVSQDNHKGIEQIGDVKSISYNDNILHYGDNSCISPIKIDLLIGGSPCQGFSRAGVGLNFNDERSKLFFEYVRILKETKPKYFFLENVNMKKERQDIITEILGVEPIKINSKLFVPHNRPRTYWTNIPVDQDIKQREYKLSEILDQRVDEKYYIKDDLYNKIVLEKKEDHLIVKNGTNQGFLRAYPGACVNVSFPNSKTRRGRVKPNYVGCQTTGKSDCIVDDDLRLRYMIRNEVERSQGLNDGYTGGVSENQAQKICGNGWTIDVIEYFFKNIENRIDN